MRDPDDPMGCPRATAPPRTFTFSMGIPRILLLANGTAENASLISKKSMSETLRPAAEMALGKEMEGATGKSIGFPAPSAYDRILANGFNPNSLAFSADMR